MEIEIRSTLSLSSAPSYLLSSITTVLFLGASAAAGIVPVWLGLNHGSPLGLTGIIYIAFMVLQAYAVLYLSFRHFKKKENNSVILGMLTGLVIFTVITVILFAKLG